MKTEEKLYIAKRVEDIFNLKGIENKDNILSLWIKQIESDFDRNILDIKKIDMAFDRLLRTKVYGRIDYADFLDPIKSDDLPDAWNMVLTSARNGGRYPINARAAKALNALGGMSRLMDASNDDLPWIKKEFDQVYLATPEYSNVEGIRCLGLRAEILPDIDSVLKISGV